MVFGLSCYPFSRWFDLIFFLVEKYGLLYTYCGKAGLSLLQCSNKKYIGKMQLKICEIFSALHVNGSF